MGSQTLEILRQGVWASLTGGWFYDPHQNLFCNTVHLYVWLFLLCLPFSVYLYFPPASLGWIIYCALVALLFTCLKLLNHGLHHMYDTSECIVLPPSSDPTNDNTARDEGIEMQMLRGAAVASSDNESMAGMEYNKPNNSTIDLKVDVHRKNSSESSNEDSTLSVKLSDVVPSTKSELCAAPPSPGGAPPPAGSHAPGHAPGPSKLRPRKPKREPRAKPRRAHGNRIDELIVEEVYRHPRPDSDLPVHMMLDEGPFAKVSRRYHECSQGRRGSNRDFFKEWLYLDGNEAVGEPYRSKRRRRERDAKTARPPAPPTHREHQILQPQIAGGRPHLSGGQQARPGAAVGRPGAVDAPSTIAMFPGSGVAIVPRPGTGAPSTVAIAPQHSTPDSASRLKW